MPNGATHKAAGAIIGPITYLLTKGTSQKLDQEEFGELILSILLGAGTAKIPDILEPAIDPNHRAFFHSIVCGGILGFFGVQIWNDLQTRRRERKLYGIKQMHQSEIIDIILLIVDGSILLHLIMDGFTKKGLPFI